MYKFKLARGKPDIEPHMADQFQSHVVLVELRSVCNRDANTSVFHLQARPSRPCPDIGG